MQIIHLSWSLTSINLKWNKIQEERPQLKHKFFMSPDHIDAVSNLTYTL